MTFREANTFDLLKEYDEVDRKFDMVILDPPAFAKTATRFRPRSVATKRSISAH